MFSQTAEYALRAMVHLAGTRSSTTLRSEEISRATCVPAKYLSKVLRDLVVAKLITSQRGPNGGFALSRPPKDISLYDVVQAVDPFQRIERCPLGNSSHIKLCPLHKRLDDAINLIERQFQDISLADILAENNPNPGRCNTLLQLKLPLHQRPNKN